MVDERIFLCEFLYGCLFSSLIICISNLGFNLFLVYVTVEELVGKKWWMNAFCVHFYMGVCLAC